MQVYFPKQKTENKLWRRDIKFFVHNSWYFSIFLNIEMVSVSDFQNIAISMLIYWLTALKHTEANSVKKYKYINIYMFRIWYYELSNW